MAENTYQPLHGTYYHAARANRIYTGVSPSTGAVIILPAIGGDHPSLWNPAGSGRNLSIVRLELSWVSGDNAPTALEWASVAQAGSAAATGAPVVDYTIVAPVGVVGGSLDNVGRWSPTTNSYVAAPIFLRPSGLSLFTGISTTAVAPFTMRAKYDGDFVIAPGTVICLCTQTTTTTAAFQVAVTWEEIDID